MLPNSISVLFTLIIIAYPTQSMTTDQDICYNKASMRNRTYYCPRIKNTTRIIFSDDTSNYLNYLGGQLKILHDDNMVIFYNCPNHKTVTRLYSSNFSQFDKNRRRLTHDFGQIPPFDVDIRFQSCLEGYCHFDLDSILFCESNRISSLNFGLNAKVNISCLETITLAYIHSLNLFNVNTSKFFMFAINLVKLVISGSKHIKIVQCDIFYALIDLKILNIFALSKQNAICIFKFNPRLALISNGTNYIWNMCNGTFEFVDELYFVPKTTTTTTITSMAMPMFLSTPTPPSATVTTMTLYILLSVIILIVTCVIINPYKILRNYFSTVGILIEQISEDIELRYIDIDQLKTSKHGSEILC